MLKLFNHVGKIFEADVSKRHFRCLPLYNHVRNLYGADDVSRRHFQMHFVSTLRVNTDRLEKILETKTSRLIKDLTRHAW